MTWRLFRSNAPQTSTQHSPRCAIPPGPQFDDQEIIAVIQTMRRVYFYKSMTSHADAAVWQDVYHVPSDTGMLDTKIPLEDAE